jgi:pyruvate,water dikinase
VTAIAWFDEVGKDDVGVAGGKGANLGELTRAGLSVPPGFIVKAAAYFALLEQSGIRSRIAAVLSGLDPANNQQLAAAADEIKRLLQNAVVTPDVADGISEACERLDGDQLAVRSSATVEDLAEASFAGQQSTFLNVRTDRVEQAVRACWASLFEPQAIAYRAQKGFDHLEVGMAVVVQRMVQSARSGVMFTLHPVTGDPGKIIIEAVYGLGEAAVSGVVTPDCYIVDKASLAIEEKEVAHQERQLVRDAAAHQDAEPNGWVNVPPDRARLQKLSDDEIATVAELGRRVEAHYGSPQDIEWAEEGGSFFLVQARPVTAGM